jgi:hypothetical protein
MGGVAEHELAALAGFIRRQYTDGGDLDSTVPSKLRVVGTDAAGLYAQYESSQPRIGCLEGYIAGLRLFTGEEPC